MKINGSLVFDASSASEIQNLRVQKYADEASFPAWGAADAGRMIYAIDEASLWYGSDTEWVKIASGGDATAVLAELNALESSLGTFINSDGTFDSTPTGYSFNYISSPTSVTDAIAQLDAAINSNNTLAELDDVSLGSLATGDILRYNGTAWADASLSEAGIQPLDATLTALAAYNTNGILVQTAADTFAGRSLVQPAAGITITNANGVSGNPTFALANDLAALEGLSTTGYVVRTGDGTAITRSIAGTSGNIVVTDGDGVATDTNINLAAVSQGSGGNFVKVTLDGFGRVTQNTAVVAGDITALVDSVYVNAAGDTMSGTLNMGNNLISGVAPAVSGTDAVNRNQLDAAVAGLSWKQAVRAATTGDVDLATDLEDGDTLDGVTLATGDRVLVKDQTDAEDNGIYVVQASGAAVRSSDMNAAAEFGGATVFVQEGTVNADSGWTQIEEVTTLGTDDVSFVQFTGSGTYTAGVGLALSGNTFNVNLGAGIVELPSDEVGIDLHDASTGAIILTTNGTARSTDTAAKLHLLLDAVGALAQGANGLRINSASVTNAMLVNSTISLNADSGSVDPVSLGETILFAGNPTQGIATAVTGNTITISGTNASTSAKGVASFDSSHFSVTSGAVSLAASLDDLTNVSGADAASLNDILVKSGGDWIPLSIGEVLNDSAVLADMSDVADGAVPTEGHVLTGSGGEWTNQKVYHLHDQSSADTEWVVTHSIGQQYCNVTVVDENNEVVIPQSITFDTANQLTVTFNTAIEGKVVVMGIA